MAAMVTLNFSPEYVKKRLGLHLRKKKICSNILTDFEENALSRLNQTLGLNLRSDLQKTENGLTLILKTLEARGYQKTALHHCGVSVMTLGAICVKIFYGQENYRPHQLFDRVTMVRRLATFAEALDSI
jgi:hypothetical protein